MILFCAYTELPESNVVFIVPNVVKDVRLLRIKLATGYSISCTFCEGESSKLMYN